MNNRRSLVLDEKARARQLTYRLLRFGIEQLLSGVALIEKRLATGTQQFVAEGAVSSDPKVRTGFERVTSAVAELRASLDAVAEHAARQEEFALIDIEIAAREVPTTGKGLRQ